MLTREDESSHSPQVVAQPQSPAQAHSQRGEERALLHICVLHCSDTGHQGTEHR